LVVSAKSLRDNSILLVPEGDPMLTTKNIMIRNKNSSFTGRCLVRSSNLGILVDAHVSQDSVKFDVDHRLVAPGQYLVFYSDSGMVLGGAVAS
jgi:tRNA U34 2-thiouridine synthase MnmA/TrmU